MKVSIIVPCYNEEEGIENLKNQLNPVIAGLQKGYKLEVIFIDDGSTDNTNALLHHEYGKRKYVKIIKHKKNMNLGAALKTGFRYATGNFIFTLDSDCTYHPKLIFPMLELIKDADIITASPEHPNGKIVNVQKYRIFLSKTVTNIYRIIVSPKIYTYGAMVRLYRKNAIKNIKIKADDFLAVPEIMVKAVLKGYRIRELPTTLRVRIYGGSKMKLAKTIKSHSFFIFRIILHRLTGAKL